jgi:hypothetical protein
MIREARSAFVPEDALEDDNSARYCADGDSEFAAARLPYFDGAHSSLYFLFDPRDLLTG